MPFPSPSLVPPELTDFQWSFNGLTMGAGTPYGVLLAEGLALADIRSGDVNWPRDHGQAVGLDLYAGRDIILDLWMKTDGTSLQHAQLALAAATVVRPLEEIPLWFQLPNMPLLCVMCRPRKRPIKIETDYAAAQIGKPELVLHATDPRIYQAGRESAALKPKPPGGSTVVLNNEGNTEMRPILFFAGPASRPRATNEMIAGKPYLELMDPTWFEEARAAKEAASVEEAREKEESETKESKTKEAREKLEKEERITLEIEMKEAEKFIGEPAKKEMVEAVEAKIDELEEDKIADEKEEKEAKEERETDEKEAKEERETDETEALELREKEEKEGLHPTVKTGDQLVVDTGTPHLVLYYVGGIEGKVPENVSNWLVPGSTWWDVIPNNNTVKFSSFDTADTAGTCRVQWAPAYEL